MNAAMRANLPCVQITAFGAEEVPEVKMSAHRELTSGSMPASVVACASMAAARSSSTTSIGGSLSVIFSSSGR